MREVTVAELVGEYDDPFVRHHVELTTVRRAWVSGAALVFDGGGHRRVATRGASYTCLGPVTDLAPLMTAVDRLAGAPERVSAEADAFDVVPATWRYEPRGHWHWMFTDRAPAEPDVTVVEVTDAEEINALLDAGNPDSWARPGDDTEAWLGVRDGSALVAVGSVSRRDNGSGLIQAVTVRPEARGRGLGKAVSAGLARRAVSGGSGVATLGVYVDNAPAVAVYRSLGFRLEHTFRSGPVHEPPQPSRSGSRITTAVEPSR